MMDTENGKKYIPSATGRQYLYINVRGALPRIVVIQSHHSSS